MMIKSEALEVIIRGHCFQYLLNIHQVPGICQILNVSEQKCESPALTE